MVYRVRDRKGRLRMLTSVYLEAFHKYSKLCLADGSAVLEFSDDFCKQPFFRYMG